MFLLWNGLRFTRWLKQWELNDMPDRVTKEERQISLAIEKARKVKSMLTHKLHEEVPTDEKYGEPEEVKVKRPKAQKDTTKMKDHTHSKGTHSGYGKI